MSNKFVLHIKCDNDAFVDNESQEVADILRKLADQIEQGYTASYLLDSNGNTVGYAEFKEEK